MTTNITEVEVTKLAIKLMEHSPLMSPTEAVRLVMETYDCAKETLIKRRKQNASKN